MLPVFQFVAWSGTGKTTFLEKLVAELKSRGLRVAVYKHDGHDFDIDKPGKDSWRMTKAGADVMVLSSASQAVIMENRPVAPEQLIERITGVDLILVEGYKAGPWHKIAMRRASTGKDFPIPPEECIAVITDTPCSVCGSVFGFEDIVLMADFLLHHLNGINN